TALDRFERDNEDLALATHRVLARIATDAPLHARLLNTLSMLEHLGSRKIVATQSSAGIDEPTLRHVAEEAHRAAFMKRQGHKGGGRAPESVDEDLLARAAARMYSQRLASGMKRVLGTPRATYLYMSMIVEFRALWFYRLYQRVLRE